MLLVLIFLTNFVLCPICSAKIYVIFWYFIVWRQAVYFIYSTYNKDRKKNATVYDLINETVNANVYGSVNANVKGTSNANVNGTGNAMLMALLMPMLMSMYVNTVPKVIRFSA